MEDDDTVSSLDAVQMNAPGDPVDRWDIAAEPPRDGGSRVTDADKGRTDVRRLGVDDALDYPLG